jgi:hypothetical protein
LVTDRIPLFEIFDLAAELTVAWVVMEFIPPDDLMFRRLTRGREALHDGLNRATFESACRKRFQIIQSQELPGSGRRLYLLRRKDS